MPKLSIIIPFHNETFQDLTQLLNSINSQIAVDFTDIEILLSNDTGQQDAFQKQENWAVHPSVSNISNRISLFKSQHLLSTAMSRQLCIDNAKGHFLYFMDADDIFASPHAIYQILQIINENPTADQINFSILQENSSYKQRFKKIYNPNQVIGQVYRTAFIKKNNIRSIPAIGYKHEDTYFNIIFRAHKPNVLNKKDIITYIWRENKNSITHSIPDYNFTERASFLRAYILAINELKKENIDINISEILAQIYGSYVMITEPGRKEHENICNDINSAVKDLINLSVPFLFTNKTLTEKLMAPIIYTYRFYHMPDFTFNQYLQKIKEGDFSC